jgi:hypothetical protein
MRDIDAIEIQLQSWRPDIVFEQLRVRHPGTDDDGVWLVRLPDNPAEVQLESSTGSCPFLVESNTSTERLNAPSVGEAFLAVLRGLGTSATSA